MERHNFANILPLVRPSCFWGAVRTEPSSEGAEWTEWKEHKVNGFLHAFVFPDGQMPTAAGTGPDAFSWDGRGAEEDASGQEEKTEEQRGEAEGKQTQGSLVRN